MSLGPSHLSLEDLISPLAAVSLSMARPLGLALVVPVFTRLSLGPLLQGGFAIAIAFPEVGPVLGELRHLQAAPIWLGLIAGKEVFIGILVGLLFGLPIWGLQSAGEALDTQRSAPASGGNDAGGQVSATGSLIGLSAILLFVAGGGFGAIAAALYGSLAFWPLLRLSPQFAPDAAGAMLAMLGEMGRTTLLAAAPIMLAMLLADAVVMLVGKSVPRLGLFDLAATLRNLVFAVGMTFYAVYLVEFLGFRIGALHDAAVQLGRLVR